LAAARARGRLGGRPKGLSKEALSKAQVAAMLFKQHEKPISEIIGILGISRATLYRYLKIANNVRK
jgi:DNA invertase Pin-like site-specific DNA recombinase